MADCVEKVGRRARSNFFRVMDAFFELGRGGPHGQAPTPVDLLGSELQLEALADHAGKRAAHRLPLPAGCLHHRVNRRTGERPQHRDNRGLFGAWLASWPLRGSFAILENPGRAASLFEHRTVMAR